MLKKLLFILISLYLPLQGNTFFTFLTAPQNSDNPGFTIHPNALNSFMYNPALGIKANSGMAFSYNTYPFQFYHFSAVYQKRLKNATHWGLGLSYLSSDEIPNYSISKFNEPVLLGSGRMNNIDLTINYIPAKNNFFNTKLKYGVSLKIIQEYLIEESLFGVGGDFGFYLPYSSFLSFGLSVRNIIIPLFNPNSGLPPIQISAGMFLKWPISKFYNFEILLNNSYILYNNNIVLAGVRNVFDFSMSSLSILCNYQYSWSSTYFDGPSFGMSIKMKKVKFLTLTYMADYKNAQWLHNLNIMVKFYDNKRN